MPENFRRWGPLCRDSPVARWCEREKGPPKNRTFEPQAERTATGKVELDCGCWLHSH